MEDCQTPTLAQVMEFKYEVTPTMVFDSSRLHDGQSLFVNHIHVRCFTPTMKNFQSPGLSPINECTQTLIGGVAIGVAANMECLQKSKPMAAPIKEEYFKAPLSKSKNSHQKQQSQQQQQQKQQQQQQNYQEQSQQLKNAYGSHFVGDSPPVFTLNSTTYSDTDLCIDIPSPDSSAILGSANNNSISDSSTNDSAASLSSSNNVTFTNSTNNNSNVSKNLSDMNLLDRTMNVATLLRSVGLERYTEAFEEQNVNLNQFLNMNAGDFERMGVRAVEHQKILLDLLSELNGS
ncbi:protein matrimony [Anastrepha ludens]|uniref:protein matrimony n=1 Tax=Anastrepha ludens TaxID=28586 RepID=UPI0023B05DD5|nr:protein matrimony [Anastrepha ludens]